MIATPRPDRGVAVAFRLRETETKRLSIAGIFHIHRLTVGQRRHAHVLAVTRATAGSEEPIAWLRITNGGATDNPVLICGRRFVGSDQQTVLDANTSSANRPSLQPVRGKLVNRTLSSSLRAEPPARPCIGPLGRP